MQFSLTGFSQDKGFRVFAFEGSTADRTKTKFSVKTDLALIQRYGIRMQELPLLCKGLLDRRDEDDQQRTFVFTEKEMCLYANECARAREAALQKRKPPRRPSRTDQKRPAKFTAIKSSTQDSLGDHSRTGDSASAFLPLEGVFCNASIHSHDVLHALSPLPLCWDEKRRQSKCVRKSSQLDYSALSLRSLRPPPLSVPVANSHSGDCLGIGGWFHMLLLLNFAQAALQKAALTVVGD